MIKKYPLAIITIIILFLFTACFSHTHDSNVSCDITMDNEYIIKWDIFPKAEGKVKIYISDSPDKFDTWQDPISVVDADDGVAVFPTPDPLKRHYFLLNFNNCFSRIVAARASYIRSAYDFRDMGGYSGMSGKKTKWGMIYRTGSLDTLSAIDIQRVKNIAPKTIIEYRDKSKCKYSASELGVNNVFYMPYASFNVDSIINRVYKGEFAIQDARAVINDFYFSALVGDAKKCFSELFDVLQDETNYPIILSSSYGKGCSDLASLFILYSLGVAVDEVYEDYTWANKYFCKGHIMSKISHLPIDVREAVASVIHNNHRDIANVINALEGTYGSIDAFLIDSLNLSIDKRKNIHKILLVDESQL